MPVKTLYLQATVSMSMKPHLNIACAVAAVKREDFALAGW